MQNTLYVGNLSGDVSAEALQELFEPHGFVINVKLVRPGVAYVIMATDDAAAAAVSALDGANLHGAPIRVELTGDDENRLRWESKEPL